MFDSLVMDFWYGIWRKGNCWILNKIVGSWSYQRFYTLPSVTEDVAGRLWGKDPQQRGQCVLIRTGGVSSKTGIENRGLVIGTAVLLGGEAIIGSHFGRSSGSKGSKWHPETPWRMLRLGKYYRLNNLATNSCTCVDVDKHSKRDSFGLDSSR